MSGIRTSQGASLVLLPMSAPCSRTPGRAAFDRAALLDVGANVGDWTLMARSIFPDLPFVLIEPQKEMADKLELLAAGQSGCHVVQAGAGRVAGHAFQTIFDDPRGSSFLPLQDEPAKESGRQRLTPIIAIDDLFAPNGICR